MELFEIEIENAKKRVKSSGRAPQSFDFSVKHLEPDPDGGGMFTARYEVTCTNIKTHKTLVLLGGIGLAWVDEFAEELARGFFDC